MVLLVLAAVPLGVRAFLDLHAGVVLPGPVAFFLYYIAVLALLPRIVALRRAIKAPAHIGRRSLFVGTGVLALGAVGVAESSKNLQVLNKHLPLRDLPSGFEGTKVALLADLHRGPAVGREYLEEVVARVNSLQPDIVLMPGDFVSKSSSYYPDIQRILSGLNPRIASFATLGNHDHWEGAEGALAALDGAGVLALQNRALYVGPEGRVGERPAPGALCLAGVDDLWVGEPNIEFLADVPTDKPVILLSHHPDIAEKFKDCGHRVDVQFSGHTHGGQVVLPGVGPLATASAYGTKYVYGWAEGPSWPVFTTCGIGTSTIPVRVGTTAEIVLFELRKA